MNIEIQERLQDIPQSLHYAMKDDSLLVSFADRQFDRKPGAP